MFLYLENEFGTIHLGNNVETYILIFVAVAVFAFFVWILFYKTPSQKAEEKAVLEELEEPYEEPPIEEIDVTVIKLHCGAKVYGSKTPRAVKEFYAVFKTENGEETELSVDEESYFSLKENTKGTLALVNGNFYGFCEEE